MKEKLSVRKVYKSAFFFLTFFYFMGSLLPMWLGASSFFVVSTFYIYLFFYFAAGCYYKQQILWDKQIFMVAGLRFLTAIVLFLIALLVTTLVINCVIHFVKLSFNGALSGTVESFLGSSVWRIGRYIFIFLLFNALFLVPSFAFVSEITGKNRSLLMTFARTKGNILRIATVTALAVVLLVVVMSLLTYINIFLAALFRAFILVFISILYFKMYDFFYCYPNKKVKEKTLKMNIKNSKEDKIFVENNEEIESNVIEG